MKYYIIPLFFIVITSCSQTVNHEPSVSLTANADYYQQAQHYYLTANYDTAMTILNQAMEVIDTANYQDLAKAYLLRSKVANSLTLFEASMEDAHKALSISEQHQFIDHKTSALLSIGGVYYMMYNNKKAEEFFLKAKSIAEEYKLQSEMMQVAGFLGRLYSSLERTVEAFPLLNQALDIAQKQSDTLRIIEYLTYIGDCYITLNRRANQNEIVKEYQQTAKRFLDEAMELALIKNEPKPINTIRFGYIRWYRVENNYPKALEYAQKILQNTDLNANPNTYTFLMQLCTQLGAIYAYLGEARQANHFYQQSYSMMKEQSDYRLHRSLQEMSVKYDVQQKEQAHQAEREREKTQRLMLGGGLIAAILLLVLLVLVVALHRKRNHELAETNVIKDKFFSIISHDLRNPAIVQRDNLQILADNAEKWEPKTISGYSRNLLKSADGLVDLLENLLGWARIQTGRKVFYPSTFEMIEALQPDINIIKNLAERKNIAFETLTPETAYVTGDDNMLTTVVRNLLANAVKFTPKGGKIGFLKF